MKVLTLVRVNWDIQEMAQTVKVFYELNVKFLSSTKESPILNPTGRSFALHRCGNTSRGVSISTCFFSSVYSSQWLRKSVNEVNVLKRFMQISFLCQRISQPMGRWLLLKLIKMQLYCIGLWEMGPGIQCAFLEGIYPSPNDTHDKLSFGPNSFKFHFRHKRMFYRSPSVRWKCCLYEHWRIFQLCLHTWIYWRRNDL